MAKPVPERRENPELRVAARGKSPKRAIFASGTFPVSENTDNLGSPGFRPLTDTNTVCQYDREPSRLH